MHALEEICRRGQSQRVRRRKKIRGGVLRLLWFKRSMTRVKEIVASDPYLVYTTYRWLSIVWYQSVSNSRIRVRMKTMITSSIIARILLCLTKLESYYLFETQLNFWIIIFHKKQCRVIVQSLHLVAKSTFVSSSSKGSTIWDSWVQWIRSRIRFILENMGVWLNLCNTTCNRIGNFFQRKLIVKYR